MKVKIGQIWQRRDGRKVKVTDRDGDKFEITPIGKGRTVWKHGPLFSSDLKLIEDVCEFKEFCEKYSDALIPVMKRLKENDVASYMEATEHEVDNNLNQSIDRLKPVLDYLKDK